IEAQVMRMLGGAGVAKARSGVLSLFQQWLDLRGLDDGFGNGPSKDAKLYPMWNPTLRHQMRQETEAFVGSVLWDGDAKLTTLLTAPFSFVTDKLAAVYGLGGVTGTAMLRHDLDPTQRGGLLTQGSYLALRSYAVLTDPVHRGLFVRERLLCQHMPSPPST